MGIPSRKRGSRGVERWCAGPRRLVLASGYLREVTEKRPKGRTKIATETKTLKVGDPAPDFTLRAHDGRTITLSALRGQRVVIAFMAFAFSGT